MDNIIIILRELGKLVQIMLTLLMCVGLLGAVLKGRKCIGIKYKIPHQVHEESFKNLPTPLKIKYAKLQIKQADDYFYASLVYLIIALNAFLLQYILKSLL